MKITFDQLNLVIKTVESAALEARCDKHADKAAELEQAALILRRMPLQIAPETKP